MVSGEVVAGWVVSRRSCPFVLEGDEDNGQFSWTTGAYIESLDRFQCSAEEILPLAGGVVTNGPQL